LENEVHESEDVPKEITFDFKQLNEMYLAASKGFCQSYALPHDFINESDEESCEYFAETYARTHLEEWQLFDELSKAKSIYVEGMLVIEGKNHRYHTFLTHSLSFRIHKRGSYI
jgi:hypothetical protein